MVAFVQRFAGEPMWIEYFARNPHSAVELFSAALNWDAKPTEEFEDYALMYAGHGMVAGIGLQFDELELRDQWLITCDVKNAAQAAQKVEAFGGVIHVHAGSSAEGNFFVAQDPGGAWVCGWESDGVTGMQVHDEPGAPAWFELHTARYDESLVFYREVFGWDLVQVNEPGNARYSVLGDSRDDARAGIMDASNFFEDGESAMWAVFFEVVDTTKAVAAIESHGGKVVERTHPTWLGTVTGAISQDGGFFKLLESH
ncbi:VOC family protein [Timonella sp. A28]|uniref:VOC family protein n=1 Tax=Timonella sp. A28 TaxID=3442640 RepID=UPI003EBA498D